MFGFRKYWLLIILFAVIAAVPNIVRLYKIKELYISGNVQSMAIESNIVLKNKYGIGASDLKLLNIVEFENNTNLLFAYRYHGAIRKSAEAKYFSVTFDEQKNINISEY